MHIICISCIFLAYLSYFYGSIPASPVAGCSCTIPALAASPTTTGSCALFIARKATQAHADSPGYGDPWPAR